MPSQPKSVAVGTYLVVEPAWHPRSVDAQGRPLLTGAKVQRATKNRPTVVDNGGIVVHFTFEIDADALLPLQPEAHIIIHAGDVEVIQPTVHPPTPEESTAP